MKVNNYGYNILTACEIPKTFSHAKNLVPQTTTDAPIYGFEDELAYAN
jgi:hypothetical protein